MKIEEAIKRIEKMGEYECFVDEPVSKVAVISIVRQVEKPKLDQPKPEVPQFVADWYEEHKRGFYLKIHKLAWELIENIDEDRFDNEFQEWYYENETAIQTLINMHQFGYIVEKEKLYTVEIPTLRGKQEGFKKLMLIRRSQGSDNIDLAFVSNPDSVLCRLKEQEIRKDFDWAWQFAKEVKNGKRRI